MITKKQHVFLKYEIFKLIIMGEHIGVVVEKNLEKKMELSDLKAKKEMEDMNKKLDAIMALLTKKA